MNDTRERLAEYAHAAWAGWMRYLFEKSIQVKGGAVTIPIWAANRWKRQMDTEYDDLPEKEKESDRHEADKMLAIMMKAPGKMLCRGKVESSDPIIRKRWAYGYFARVGGKDIIILDDAELIEYGPGQALDFVEVQAETVELLEGDQRPCRRRIVGLTADGELRYNEPERRP